MGGHDARARSPQGRDLAQRPLQRRERPGHQARPGRRRRRRRQRQRPLQHDLQQLAEREPVAGHLGVVASSATSWSKRRESNITAFMLRGSGNVARENIADAAPTFLAATGTLRKPPGRRRQPPSEATRGSTPSAAADSTPARFRTYGGVCRLGTSEPIPDREEGIGCAACSRSMRDRSATAFARRSVAVRHALVDHPLFAMDAIAELADRLPPDSVRRERGDLPIVNRDGYVDVGHGPPSATIRDVERNGFRISLRDIQQVRRVRRAHQRVPRRGRADRREPRGGHAAAHGLPLHHRPRLQHADALRPRAQLPAAGQGREARQRRGLRRRLASASASSTTTTTATSATSRRWRTSQRTSASTPASGSTCPRSCPTG